MLPWQQKPMDGIKAQTNCDSLGTDCLNLLVFTTSAFLLLGVTAFLELVKTELVCHWCSHMTRGKVYILQRYTSLSLRPWMYLNIQCVIQYKCRKLWPLTHKDFFLMYPRWQRIEIVLFVRQTARVSINSPWRNLDVHTTVAVEVLRFNLSLFGGGRKGVGRGGWLPLLGSRQAGLSDHTLLTSRLKVYCPLKKARWPLVHLLA